MWYLAGRLRLTSVSDIAIVYDTDGTSLRLAAIPQDFHGTTASARRRLICLLVLIAQQMTPAAEDSTPVRDVRAEWQRCGGAANDRHWKADLHTLPVEVVNTPVLGTSLRLTDSATTACSDALQAVAHMMKPRRGRRPAPSDESSFGRSVRR
jgi:hypothetical protein